MASPWTLVKGLFRNPVGAFIKDVGRGFLWSEQDEAAAKFYRQFVPPQGLVFDVGANLGNRVKCFLRLDARVVAIEPQPDCARALRRGWGLNRRLTVLETALGERPGQATINLARSSTIASMSTEWIEAVKTSGRFGGEEWNGQLTVAVTTLEALIEKHGTPDFIKVDVEGFELEVFKGLSRPIPALSFEFTPECCARAEACVDRLASLGPVEVNLSLGESMRLEYDAWLSPDEAKRRLREFSGDTVAFGDVYVRATATR